MELMMEADGYPAGAWSCQNYYLATGELEQAWLAIRKVGRHRGTYSWFHVLEVHESADR